VIVNIYIRNCTNGKKKKIANSVVTFYPDLR